MPSRGNTGTPPQPPTILPLVLISFLFLASSSALFIPAISTSSSPPDALALLAFKFTADSGNRLLFTPTNRSLYGHCWWPGVRCSSKGGRVVRLVLESSGLEGVFAENTLGRLDQLRTLSLKNNSLAGPIPDLSGLLNLKALFLDQNRFSGGFPPSFLSLHRIRTVDLSHNNVTGSIPSNLTGLDRLYLLRLEWNHLDGSVPPLNQSSLRIFNVSWNELSGPVPVTAALSRFDPSAFSGNPGLCGEVVRKECSYRFFFTNGDAPIVPSPVSTTAGRGGQLGVGGRLPSRSLSPTSQRNHKRAAVAVAFLSGGFLLIGLVGILLLVKKKLVVNNRRLLNPQKISASVAIPSSVETNTDSSNSNREDKELAMKTEAAAAMSDEKVKKLGKSGCLVFCAGETPVYTLEQLMKGSAELLGKGSVGTTYRAVLDNRLVLCVKRLDAGKMRMAGREDFGRHMDTVGRLRHPNLVPLRAYFLANEERILVYDYQPNGSLFSLIHGSKSTRAKPFHWTSCLKIAEDVAQGLGYIHQASRLVHGNLRSSNVLLGSDFEACLADNCLAFLVEPSNIEGNSGYQAPETRKSDQRLTPYSDIYAFGVLLLELLTGKRPLEHPILIASDLPAWVQSMRGDEGAEDEQLMMLLDIASACVRSSPESRPMTWQVLKMLQEVKESDVAGDDETDSTSIS